MIKKKLQVSGLHCVSCSMLIEGELEDIGVQASCNYAKQIVDMVYDEKKITKERIKETIEKLGYRVV